MKLNQHLKDWKQIVSCRFPRMTLPQISGLATGSFAMVMTRSSSVTQVSNLIAKINAEPENTVRQRLKEWYKSGEAKSKKGNKRASVEVNECFSSLLEWIFADVSWYGFRSWIECSYRDIKSDGWQWHKTRLRQPNRAERHWLAMAVAMLWMVTLGGEQEFSNDESISDRRSRSQTSSAYSLSCFVNGLLTVVAQLLNGESLTLGRLFPLPLSHFNDLAFVNSS